MATVSVRPDKWIDREVVLELSGYEAARLLACVSAWRPCTTNGHGKEVAVADIERALMSAIPREHLPRELINGCNTTTPLAKPAPVIPHQQTEEGQG